MTSWTPEISDMINILCGSCTLSSYLRSLLFLVYQFPFHFLYSSPLLIRSSLLQWKNGLIRGVAHLDGGQLNNILPSQCISNLLKFTSCFAHGRWFSPSTLAFSITKTGRHDIAEILLKVALNTKKKQKTNNLKSGLIREVAL